MQAGFHPSVIYIVHQVAFPLSCVFDIESLDLPLWGSTSVQSHPTH